MQVLTGTKYFFFSQFTSPIHTQSTDCLLEDAVVVDDQHDTVYEC